MNKNILKFILFFILSAIFVCIDQFTKKMAKKFLMGNDPKVLINNVLELTYTENRGAAFGIMQGKQILFFVLTIVVLVVLLYLLYNIEFNINNILYFFTILLIFSGAIGNFIDRVLNKYVVDFIYFKPIDFPVFNFADIYITIGCFLLIITMLRKS